MRHPIWIGLLFLLTLPALADTQAPTYDRVRLSEKAGIEVRNDTMVAVLRAQHEGRRVGGLAERVNREIAAAIRTARATPGVEVSTQGYSSHPVYSEGRITAWRVSQSIRLESTRSKVLGELLGTLQDKLKLQSLGYQLSPEQRRKHIDAVIKTALQRFGRRARLIADTLGKQSWRLVDLSVNEGNAHPAPLPRTEMMAAMARVKTREAVSIESGTSRLEVQVSGEIEISD